MALASTFPKTVRPAGNGVGRTLLSLGLGAGWTLGLFLMIARFDRTTPVEPPADIMDLRAVSIQEPPPPPPEIQPREPMPIQDTLTGIESTRTDSPVQITVTPPDLESLLPPPPIAPPAVIQVGQLYSNLKPKLDLKMSGDHIFQMAEVDQVPQVLNQVTPKIPTSVRGGASTLRTSLLFIVDVNGEIKNVRIANSSGNAEFDAIIMENIHEWTFSPAIRRGQKVRCLLQQAVIIRWSGGSPFQL